MCDLELFHLSDITKLEDETQSWGTAAPYIKHKAIAFTPFLFYGINRIETM